MGLLGYSTLFLNMQRLESRFIGALTTLLVQAAWITIISDDLPTTSYIKLIDIWFTWHLIMQFIIILHHIFLDKMNTKFVLHPTLDIEPFHREMISNNFPLNMANHIADKFNMFGIVMFAVANCLFYAFYFPLSLGKIWMKHFLECFDYNRSIMP